MHQAKHVWERPVAWKDFAAEQMVKACHACQLVGQPTEPEPVVPTELPLGSWQQTASDFCGKFPTGESLLVVTDYWSRWPEVAILKSTSTLVVINHLQASFGLYGMPVHVVTDNGPQFRAAEFAVFLTELEIEHPCVTP